jgi:hypothetical protein
MSHRAVNAPREMPCPCRKSISWWPEAHRLLLALCDDLEAIADSLPRHVILKDCIDAAQTLGRLIRDVHAYEETTLFPALLERFTASPEIQPAIDRLKAEHVADECYADDLAEKLLYLGKGGKDVNFEALAYMLRGFFDAMRRHVAYERDHFSAALEALRGNAEFDGASKLN